ncbi:MAG: hypothetical protein M3Q14_04540 [bacterium]|nr:hypothetical protein [bacterium]
MPSSSRSFLLEMATEQFTHDFVEDIFSQDDEPSWVEATSRLYRETIGLDESLIREARKAGVSRGLMTLMNFQREIEVMITDA